MLPLPSMSMNRERARVREHIVGAERLARSRQVALESAQLRNRRLLLDELRLYRQRGRYPINHDVRRRAVPEFVDRYGTPCAVAHLLNISGQGELVRQIANRENRASVHQLARYPELRAWLRAAGLSLEEAARIQPSYCFVTEAEACFCNWGGLSNLGLGRVIERDAESALVRIQRMEGMGAGLGVGETAQVASAQAAVDERIFFSVDTETGYIYRTGRDLVIRGDEVTCQVNSRTKERPTSVDTVFEAMLASDDCMYVLMTDDSGWNQSQCVGEEEPALEPEATADGGAEMSSDGNNGCDVAPYDAAGSTAALTSAALFAALVAHRRAARR